MIVPTFKQHMKSGLKLSLGMMVATVLVTSCEKKDDVSKKVTKTEIKPKTVEKVKSKAITKVTKKAPTMGKIIPVAVKKENPEDKLAVKFKGSGELAQNKFTRIRGIAIGPKGTLFVAGLISTKTPVLKLKSLLVGYDKTGTEVSSWKLDDVVTSVAVDSSGIYVGTLKRTTAGAAVVKLDFNGKVVKRFGKNLVSISGLAVNKGIVAVGDNRRSLIATYDTNGKFLRNMGTDKRSGEGRLKTCCGMLDCAIDNKGQVYAASLAAFRVITFTPNGHEKQRFGKKGRKVEDFCGCCNPTNIAISPQGYIITAEKSIPKVKVYSADGSKLLALFGKNIFTKGCSNMDIAVDKSFNVYVVDTIRKCVKKFSPDK